MDTAPGEVRPVEAVPFEAWPFLIGRGVRRGNGLLLAAAAMATDERRGLVDRAVPPQGESAVIEVGRFSVVVAARRIRRSDVTAQKAPTSGFAATSDELLRDEHGRPIRILFGFAVTGSVISVDDADLTQSWAQATEAYRRFAADEHNFSTIESEPFRPASRLGPTIEHRAEDTAFQPPSREQSAHEGAAPEELEVEPTPIWLSARPLRLLLAVVIVAVLGVAVLPILGSDPVLTVTPHEAPCAPSEFGTACSYDVMSAHNEPVALSVDVEPPAAIDSFEVTVADTCLPLQPDAICTVQVEAMTDSPPPGSRLLVEASGLDEVVAVDLDGER